MAKEVLVTETLSQQMIDAGSILLKKLDEANADVKSAFWLFFSEEKTWKLILASPLVGSYGPREFYKKIVISNQQATDLDNIVSLNDIGVTNTDNQVVQLLSFAVGTGDVIAGIRFSRNTINGVFIEDSYIYRSNALLVS
ncbi:hypothetical protein [Methylomonas rosea]|uniref:Uncharacterized protein n=1 Tax=Methylomonas rosea TaxID=2952227 RepID=A0ABT1TN90_9GAMM|nr:hypothetical protein [Methylomonas sp. WSC-7]MCQ8116255.1 hypothetical protein [Methylomonas sp. WSC-7]